MRLEPHGYPGGRYPIAGDTPSLQLPDQLSAVLAYQRITVRIGAQVQVDPRWPGRTAKHTNPPPASDIVVPTAETSGDPSANIPKFTTARHRPPLPLVCRPGIRRQTERDQCSHVEAELHHVTVDHHVVLAFHPDLARGLGSGHRTGLDEVVE